MAHALTLTASSTGRAPVPTGDGSTLLVDEANAIMITVSPIPSAWDPEGLALYRGGQRVTTPPMSDGTRWVLMGDERFGTFQARATGAGALVESPVVRVVPATVSLRRTPAAPTPVAAPARESTDAALAGAPRTPAADTAPAAPAPVPAPPSSAPAPVEPAPTSPAPPGPIPAPPSSASAPVEPAPWPRPPRGAPLPN